MYLNNKYPATTHDNPLVQEVFPFGVGVFNEAEVWVGVDGVVFFSPMTKFAAFFAIGLFPYVKCSGVRSSLTKLLESKAFATGHRFPFNSPGNPTRRLAIAFACWAPTQKFWGRFLKGPIMSSTLVGILNWLGRSAQRGSGTEPTTHSECAADAGMKAGRGVLSHTWLGSPKVTKPFTCFCAAGVISFSDLRATKAPWLRIY